MTGDTLPRCMLDSNIWLYAFVDQGEAVKQAIAQDLVRQTRLVVSTQIINEVCYNLLRKASFTEEQIGRTIHAFYDRYIVVPVDQEAMIVASVLRKRYSLSFWDGLITAAAYNAGCDILYSEDMQDGLLIDGRLTVKNPFATQQ